MTALADKGATERWPGLRVLPKPRRIASGLGHEPLSLRRTREWRAPDPLVQAPSKPQGGGAASLPQKGSPLFSQDNQLHMRGKLPTRPTIGLHTATHESSLARSQ